MNLVISKEEESIINVIIGVVGNEKKWEKRPTLFLEHLALHKGLINKLVESYRGVYRYVPISIYLLTEINDVGVSDAFFKRYGKEIEKEFLHPSGEVHSYTKFFFTLLTGNYPTYPTTDNMTGAVFALRDLTFLDSFYRGNKKKAGFLEYLYNQIDNYMEASDEKEDFRAKILKEKKRTEGLVAEEKGEEVLDLLNELFVKIEQIGSPSFTKKVLKAIDEKAAKMKAGGFRE